METGGKGSAKVMVVIDETEHSYYAFIWVLDNLRELVTKSSLIIFATQPLPNSQDLISSIQQRAKKISLGLCKKAKAVCASRGVSAEAFTEAGDPKEAICNAVYKHGINLLVMANQPSSPFKRVFAESLSDYCLSNAKCPVLLVEKPAEQKTKRDM